MEESNEKKLQGHLFNNKNKKKLEKERHVKLFGV